MIFAFCSWRMVDFVGNMVYFQKKNTTQAQGGSVKCFKLQKYSLAFSAAQNLVSMLNHELIPLQSHDVDLLSQQRPTIKISHQPRCETNNKICYWKFYNVDTIHNLLKLHDLQWISTDLNMGGIYCDYHRRSNRNHQLWICLCQCWLKSMMLYSNIASQESRGKSDQHIYFNY